MKLIDILVQELPKRGGWPDGVEEIWQDYDRLMRPLGWFHDDLCEDHRRQHCDAEVKVNQRQYEAALSASKNPEWNGEGLPPVGCKCDWQDRNTKKWMPVRVVYSSEWVTVIREDKPSDPVELAIENYGDKSRCQFRPLRSEADRKRDEAASSIQSLFDSYNEDVGNDELARFGERLLQKIAGGKIPGIRIE